MLEERLLSKNNIIDDLIENEKYLKYYFLTLEIFGLKKSNKKILNYFYLFMYLGIDNRKSRKKCLRLT